MQKLFAVMSSEEIMYPNKCMANFAGTLYHVVGCSRNMMNKYKDCHRPEERMASQSNITNS